MRSRYAVGPSRRTRVARIVGISAGWRPRRLRHSRCGTASPRIPSSVIRRNEADPAEEVVLRGPDADLEALLREGRDGCLGKAGLELNPTAGCVQPPARNRLAGRETFVEH